MVPDDTAKQTASSEAAAWGISAVTVGASLFGIAGVLLGIPLMAAAYQILKDDLRAREKPVKKEEA